MRYSCQLEELRNSKSTHLTSVVDSYDCQSAISNISKICELQQSDIATQIIAGLKPTVFNRDVREFLTMYYKEDFVVKWPVLDVVSDDAYQTYVSTAWHCDTGLKGFLKCFLYLNSVSVHGCNTLIIDEVRTKQLRVAGALPLELDKRYTDISPFLHQVGMSEEPIQYDLSAGDLLIFAPNKLAHRCLPPRLGKKRYTVCFSVFPASAFG